MVSVLIHAWEPTARSVSLHPTEAIYILEQATALFAPDQKDCKGRSPEEKLDKGPHLSDRQPYVSSPG